MADELTAAISMKTSYFEIPCAKNRQLSVSQFLLSVKYLNEYLPTIWDSYTVPNNINSKSMEEATSSYSALISRWPLGAYQVRSDCEEN
jgi:hypothetical protein